MEVFFGWGKHLSNGLQPSVAMNANHEIVMAHVPTGNQLAYRWGTPRHATVIWSGDIGYEDGREPSIAISRTKAVAVHRAVKDDRLFYGLGTLGNGRIEWAVNKEYDTGKMPQIAITDSGSVLEVHHSQNTSRVWYNVGRIDGSSIDWNKKDDFADGDQPSVAMNNNGQAIVAYTRGGAVFYRILTTDGKGITIQAEHNVAQGSYPTVAVTDEGWFLLCYVEGERLMQRVGVIDGTTVSWGNALEYDTGTLPSVAAQNGLAVQVHIPVSGDRTREFFSTSLITDRSRWMSDRVVELGPLPLNQLVLPGSHDAAMYGVGIDAVISVAKTQNKDIYQQLTYGQRWLDLRVVYVPSAGIYIHHGSAAGPPLGTVLSDIQKFMQKGGTELIVLKFSHFADFSTHAWELMVAEINDKLGYWLYRGPLPAGKRLADLTLNDYAHKLLVVADGNWAKDHPQPGFWIYRASSSANAAEGDLRVYDHFSNTNSYDTMKTDQTVRFENYDGKCKDGSACDLFLLQWTLTPQGDEAVEPLARKVNPHLGADVDLLPAVNTHGKILNILNTDYCEYARPTDVAITQKDPGPAEG